MNTAAALFSEIRGLACRTARSNHLRPGLALASRVCRPCSAMIFGVRKIVVRRSNQGNKRGSEPLVAVPTILALTAVIQRVDLVLQASHRSCSQSIRRPEACKATTLSLEGLVSQAKCALANMAQPVHQLHQGSERMAGNCMYSGFQWCMDLVVEASEEELVQLKAEAEVEMGKLIDTYHQKCEGGYRVVGALAGLADCVNSVLMRADLPAALCAIAVQTLGMDLRLPEPQEVPLVDMLDQLEEALANGAGQSTSQADRQQELAAAIQAAPPGRPEGTTTRSAASEPAMSGVKEEEEATLSATSPVSSQAGAVPSGPVETPNSPAACKESDRSAIAAEKMQGASPAPTSQGIASVLTASSATAAPAAEATAGVPADSPAATAGLATNTAETAAGLHSATAGTTHCAPTAYIEPATSNSSLDSAAAAEAALAVPDQANQAKDVPTSPVDITYSAEAAPSLFGGVEKLTFASSSPDIVGTDNMTGAASTVVKTEAVPYSPVSLTASRAAASSPNSTEVAARKSAGMAKASLRLTEKEEEGQSGCAVKALASKDAAVEGRATPSSTLALISKAGPRVSAPTSAAEVWATPSSPSAQTRKAGPRLAAPISAAEGRTPPSTPLRGEAKARAPVDAAEGKAAPSSPSVIPEAAAMPSVTASAKARAILSSPSANSEGEAERSQSAAAGFTEAHAAAKLSKATMRAIAKPKKARSTPRGSDAKAATIAAKHAAGHPAATSSPPAGSAPNSLAVNDTAARQAAAHRQDKQSSSAVFAQMPDHQSAVSQAFAAGAGASPGTGAFSSVQPPTASPPSTTALAVSSAAAAAADHTTGHAAGYAPSHSSAPLVPFTPSPIVSSADSGHAASGDFQPAHTGAELKPSIASVEGGAEAEWEVVPGAEHLKQLKDPKARWLSSGATCTVKKARVRSEAELSHLHSCPDMNGLKPGQDVVIKAILIDQGANEELAENEVVVLTSMAGKPYVPTFYGSFRSGETQEGSGVMRPCSNLIMELGSLCRRVEGRDLKSIIEAVQKKVRSKSTPKAEVAALSAWVWQLTLHVASALAQIMLDMHSYRSHRDVKPANVMVSWQGGQVLVTLIDFAGSRLHHQEYLRNGAFTPSYASPQLIQHVGSGRMPVMDDVANDMWALGAVLFELSTSTERGWTHHYGPFMFGPRPKDIKRCNKGGMDQRISRTRKAIQKEHDLWEQSNGAYNQDYQGTCLQLLTLCMAAIAADRQQTQEFKLMLSALMHPQVQSRMTAEQMQQLKWLQDTAAVPLGPCPSAL